MRLSAFKSWLSERYSANSVNVSSSSAKRVEDAYGDLDIHYSNGTLDELIEQLRYTKQDEREGKPNPTKLNIGGNPYNVLNNFRSALKYYQAFMDDGGAEGVAQQAAMEQAAEIIKANKDDKLFELERNMQEVLREEIGQLDPTLRIIDDGTEISVNSGQIDILAEDSDGCAVVIELKKGLARREAIGQITGYMGDMVTDEGFNAVRGILIAADFDKSCQAAVRVIPNLELRTYRFSFTFDQPEWA